MNALLGGFTLLVSAVAGDVHIVGGDTLVVSGTAIGLAGVDAPPPGTPDGDAARSAMRSFTDGKPVTCHLSGPPDGPYRAGVCYAGGEDMGAALVRLGLALDCPRTSAGRYRPLEPEGARDRLTQSGDCLATLP